MKTPFLFFAAVSPLMATVQGCKGHPNEISVVIPKQFKSSDKTEFYLKWERPWGIEINRGGRLCTVSAGSDRLFVYGSLNTTYMSNTFYAKPMNYFGDFVEWTSNGTSRIATSGDMKWHISKFSADVEKGQVTSLVLDILEDGAV
jgi:hypothetical protein